MCKGEERETLKEKMERQWSKMKGRIRLKITLSYYFTFFLVATILETVRTMTRRPKHIFTLKKNME